MNFDSSIKKMLESYNDKTPIIDKLREVLQQTALLGLARHQFFEHAIFYGGTALRILYGYEIDWTLAKSDVSVFIADKSRLDIWSNQFFHDLVRHLRVADSTTPL